MNLEAITKFITPSIGLNLLKKGIEKKLGHPVASFRVTYIAAEEKIFFTVDQTVSPYESQMTGAIIKFVKEVATRKLQAGQSVDIINLTTDGKETVIESCITNPDSTKVKQTIKI